MKELDPIIHSQLRLAVLSLLMSMEEVDFMFLMEKTGSSTGNLSVQITKLLEAGYIDVEKTFRNKRPRTVCRMTEAGREAFVAYVATLKQLVAPALDDVVSPGVMPALC